MPIPDEATIKRVALAVVVTYVEKQDNDTEARKALNTAAAAAKWSRDDVEGFFTRERTRLKSAAQTLRKSIDSVASEEKKHETTQP